MDYIDNIKTVLSNEQQKQLKNIDRALKLKISLELYAHSLETLYFSIKLVSILFPYIFSGKVLEEYKQGFTDQSQEKAGKGFLYKICIASLLHDYGKILGNKDLADISMRHELGLTYFEKNCYPILHSFVAPFLIKRDFGIEDKDVGRAIRSHTIGSCNMNILDRIIYLSDKLETTRNYEGIEYLRKLSMEDLDLCLLEVYKSNIIYVINKNYSMHPDTSKIWNYICGGYKNVT